MWSGRGAGSRRSRWVVHSPQRPFLRTSSAARGGQYGVSPTAAARSGKADRELSCSADRLVAGSVCTDASRCSGGTVLADAGPVRSVFAAARVDRPSVGTLGRGRAGALGVDDRHAQARQPRVVQGGKPKQLVAQTRATIGPARRIAASQTGAARAGLPGPKPGDRAVSELVVGRGMQQLVRVCRRRRAHRGPRGAALRRCRSALNDVLRMAEWWPLSEGSPDGHFRQIPLASRAGSRRLDPTTPLFGRCFAGGALVAWSAAPRRAGCP